METKVKEISRKLKTIVNVRHRHVIAQYLVNNKIEQFEVVEKIENLLPEEIVKTTSFYQDHKAAEDDDKSDLIPSDEIVLKTEKGYYDFRFFYIRR